MCEELEGDEVKDEGGDEELERQPLMFWKGTGRHKRKRATICVGRGRGGE